MSCRRSFTFAVVVLLFAAACAGGGDRPAASPKAPSKSAGQDAASGGESSPPSKVTTVAEAALGKVAVYESPDGGRPRHTLANPQESGAPLVFVVQEEQPNWLKVELPVRPNGSTGWIKAADVRLSQHDWRIVVEVSGHRITVYQGTTQFLQEPVGVGTATTPTPGGRYYIKELLRPPDPRSVYGVYAYGLSGFSNVLTTFAGGPGVIGIHGTNDPSSLGKDVSAGCIRMSNEGITRLAANLPLGTPVEIRP